nr:F-box only protein 8-like [Ipomoea batatas]
MDKLKKMDDSSTPATSIASLPQEIILKILTTLPPKSAVSFRCTSKFFHSFIPRPHFAFRILFWVSSTNLYTVGYTTEESRRWLRPSSVECSAHELQRFKRLLMGSSFVCSTQMERPVSWTLVQDNIFHFPEHYLWTQSQSVGTCGQ